MKKRGGNKPITKEYTDKAREQFKKIGIKQKI
jgi:hypothetical protein